MFTKLHYGRDYGQYAWQPPTQTIAAIHRACTLALDILFIMLFSFNLYAQISLGSSYIVLAEGQTSYSFVQDVEAKLMPWEKPYIPEHPIVTIAEYEEIKKEQLAWMDPINNLGMFGILAYILLAFTQPWYRNKLKYRIENYNKKGRLSEQNK